MKPKVVSCTVISVFTVYKSGRNIMSVSFEGHESESISNFMEMMADVVIDKKYDLVQDLFLETMDDEGEVRRMRIDIEGHTLGLA
jgi:hypothetical protein